MAGIDEALLDEKLAVLERAREWSPRLIAKLEALLHSADDIALVRINPLGFARDKAIAPSEAIDLFLHAARAGLFNIEWHLLCPRCGGSVESFASLRRVQRHFFCALCDLSGECHLDDYIQVSFTVAPGLRRLSFHDPTSLSAEDYFYKLRMSREMHLMGIDGPRMSEMMPAFMKALTWVQPGEKVTWSADFPAGEFSAVELAAHTGVVCKVEADASATHLDLVIDETEVTASGVRLRAGRIDGTVENRRHQPLVFAISHKPADLMALGPPVTALEPFLTGGMLLTNQTFRRLFRAETVEGTEGIGVRDVTVLFTNLKGSTALYERIGDLKAFSLVQQHFQRLGTAVQQNAGAIVKTIGDAVMAAFTRPADAVRAAVEMQAQIERFNREHGGNDVVLEIGIHRGPSIAVTLNESLDYFGHTVNVAARVQGLAGANEIYVTDDVYRAEGVGALLMKVESRDAQLRGIQKEVRVHKALLG